MMVMKMNSVMPYTSASTALLHTVAAEPSRTAAQKLPPVMMISLPANSALRRHQRRR